MKRRLIIRLSTGLVCVACIAAFPSRAKGDYEHLSTINDEIRVDPWPIINGRASQGIAAYEGTFYTARGGALALDETIFKYDQSWNLLDDVAVDYAPWIKHVGDITADEDYIYVPVSDVVWPDVTPSEANIAIYSRDNLSYNGVYMDLYEEDYYDGYGDIAAGLDFYDGYLYGVEYQKSGEPRIINFDSGAQYKIPSLNANGIDIYGNEYGSYAYLSCGDKIGFDEGTIEVYNLDSLQEGIVNQPLMKYTYDTTHTHAEGLTFDEGDEGMELWVAQDHYVQQIETPVLPGTHLYNDGGVHNILDGDYGLITVDNPPPSGPFYTTVNFGGTAEADLLESYNYSQVTVTGGQVGFAFTHDNSQFTISGGSSRSPDELWTYGHSSVTVNSTEIDDLEAYEYSQVTFNESGADAVRAHGNSKVVVNGGSFNSPSAGDNSRMVLNGVGNEYGILAYGNGQITVNGGSGGMGLFVTDDGHITVNSLGPESWSIPDVVHAADNGHITIVGSDFDVYSDEWHPNLVFSGFGDLDSLFNGCFLTGVLAGDMNFSVPLHIENNGQISLVPVPGAFILVVLGLSVAGVKLRKHA